MRKIKFRAWNTVLKLMSDEFSFNDFDREYLIPEGWYISQMEIMQYTGLNDRYYKEIYEGDIIPEKRDANDLSPRLCVVTMGEHDNYDGGTAYGWYLEGSAFNQMPFPGDEVIGNIYQNPELLA